MKTRSSKFPFHLFTFFALLISLAGSMVMAAPAQAATNLSAVEPFLNRNASVEGSNHRVMPDPVYDSVFSIPFADPPFSGTIFIDPDIITASDPTTFLNVVDAGQGLRTMFDRRVDNFITVNAYLFNATFSDGLTIEVQVNPEFGSSAAALVEAQKYGWIVGQLPNVLRTDIKTLWIHKGTELFGGGNNSILIHTGQTDLYVADGILEETLVHEASHTSLDANHAAAPNWLAAQTADVTFISTYARDNPTREDVAESFLPYLAVHNKADRIAQSLADTILQTIPNRIAYFDSQSFNLYPLQSQSIFSDVPPYYWANSYIERLYNAGITGGCTTTPLAYCPDNTVTRAQMAIFLLKGIHGSSYAPPGIGVSTGFSDVAIDYWAAAWVKQLAAEGITGGCGSGNYCPEATVTRAQMAVFLLKAKHGSSYAPPAATGVFTDVPVGYWADKWIEQLAVEGITGGCGTGLYCPDSSVTRAQMAVFLVKTFNLP